MNLFWIVVGIVITRVLDKPIERLQRRLIYRCRSILARLRSGENSTVTQDEFRLGKWRVPWVVVDGSSSDPYAPSNLICQLDPRPLSLPADRQSKKEQIEIAQARIAEVDGRREFHNGPTVALAGIGRGQIGVAEDSLLILRLRHLITTHIWQQH